MMNESRNARLQDAISEHVPADVQPYVIAVGGDIAISLPTKVDMTTNQQYEMGVEVFEEGRLILPLDHNQIVSILAYHDDTDYESDVTQIGVLGHGESMRSSTKVGIDVGSLLRAIRWAEAVDKMVPRKYHLNTKDTSLSV
jgi:hypothetical protein